MVLKENPTLVVRLRVQGFGADVEAAVSKCGGCDTVYNIQTPTGIRLINQTEHDFRLRRARNCSTTPERQIWAGGGAKLCFGGRTAAGGHHTTQASWARSGL